MCKVQWPESHNRHRQLQRIIPIKRIYDSPPPPPPSPWTKWPPFRRRNFKRICWNEQFCILIRISLKFVSKGSIDNKLALVQVMACRLFGASSMLIQFTDVYIRHQVEKSYMLFCDCTLVLINQRQTLNGLVFLPMDVLTQTSTVLIITITDITSKIGQSHWMRSYLVL